MSGLLVAAYLNAVMCAVNVAMYIAVGHHWWSASVSALCALTSLICGMHFAASTVRVERSLS